VRITKCDPSLSFAPNLALGISLEVADQAGGPWRITPSGSRRNKDVTALMAFIVRTWRMRGLGAPALPQAGEAQAMSHELGRGGRGTVNKVEEAQGTKRGEVADDAGARKAKRPKTENPKVFFDIDIGGNHAGRIVMEVRFQDHDFLTLLSFSYSDYGVINHSLLTV
jgi:hypothetical protein